VTVSFLTSSHQLWLQGGHCRAVLRDLRLCAAEGVPDATLESAGRNWRIGGLWVSTGGAEVCSDCDTVRVVPQLASIETRSVAGIRSTWKPDLQQGRGRDRRSGRTEMMGVDKDASAVREDEATLRARVRSGGMEGRVQCGEVLTDTSRSSRGGARSRARPRPRPRAPIL
jgi:hypothetical protein